MGQASPRRQLLLRMVLQPPGEEGQCGPWAMPWKGRKSYFLRALHVQQHVFEGDVQLERAGKGYRGQVRWSFMGRVMTMQRMALATALLTRNALVTQWVSCQPEVTR